MKLLNKFFIAPIVTALAVASFPVSAQRPADSELSSPSALAFDSSGNLFVTNGGGTIIKFAPDGTRSTFATGISGAWGLPFDKAGNLFLLRDFHSIVKFTPDGTRITFATEIRNPQGLAVDSAGNLFVSDMGTGSILTFTPSGTKGTFAAGIALPRDLAFDGSGNLFVSDLSHDPMIAKFTPAGAKSTFATGVNVRALSCDKAGNLFVADGKGESILKFAPDGSRSTFATGIGGAAGMAFDGAGNLFVSDSVTDSIFKFTPGGEKSAFVAAPPVQEPVKFTLPVINVGERKAELVAGTASSDGRFALAWTVRPLKDAKPVDWSLLKKDREKFKEAYSEENYFVDILVLDVPKNKSLGRLKLAQSWYLPGFAHSSLQVLWGPQENERRFVIVNCDLKWSPQDMVLLDVDGDTISQRSVLAQCDEVVRKFALQQDRVRHRRSAKDYVGEYTVFGLPEVGRREGFSDANTLWLPFSALRSSDPKSGYAGSGTLRLKLEHGSDGPIAKIENTSVEATDKSEESISSDARFLDADHRLNQIYNALRDRLPPSERDRLKEEQRAWINQRIAVAQLTNGRAQETSLENPTAVADRELVKITQARTAELEQWLNKVK